MAVKSNEIYNFTVSPSVIKADTESTVIIESQSGTFRFFDGMEYDVIFIPTEKSDVPSDEEMSLSGWDKNRVVHTFKAKDGKLTLTHKFLGEQEWRINISSTEERYDQYEKDNNVAFSRGRWKYIAAVKKGVTLSVYSLYPDLYERNVKKCDFHIHTNFSDGTESPERTAANYRKKGFDIISITDHNIYNASAEVAKKLDFMHNFRLIPGEEVHNGYARQLHIVNVGSKYSVNDIFLDEPERVKAEVEALKGAVEVPEGVDEREYLYRVWTYREIKKSGGYAIYPHPFWTWKEHYHVETDMSEAVMKNGLCDAFELLGGCSVKENNLQIALYYSLQKDGLKMPIVGSSDSHTTMPGAQWFDEDSTVLFEKDGDTIGAIDGGYSVAVESVQGEEIRVFGDFRLMKYTHFLIKNYFARRAEICNASGIFVERYLLGDAGCRDIICACEDRIKKFENEFFGR